MNSQLNVFFLLVWDLGSGGGRRAAEGGGWLRVLFLLFLFPLHLVCVFSHRHRRHGFVKR
ncbi:hypothetical protein I7I48_06491 [Histoplasma ohiense]|nr:hypothetical protein I7I48_06491 [Histoplasma ohiense (nom. inval.)]